MRNHAYARGNFPRKKDIFASPTRRLDVLSVQSCRVTSAYALRIEYSAAGLGVLQAEHPETVSAGTFSAAENPVDRFPPSANHEVTRLPGRDRCPSCLRQMLKMRYPPA